MTRKPHIVLGISGGIAAYKAAELVRLLVKDGMDVRAVMTKAAAQFITPLTLQTLSGHKVLVHLFEPEAETFASFAPAERTDERVAAGGVTDQGIEHIDIVKEADLVVVAPATADLLAKAAHGIADDALATVLLAAGTHVAFAPAMNHRMWNHPATQANIALLKSRGAFFIEPGTGYQACGETGIGRMAEPSEIHSAIRRILSRRSDLKGRHVVVAAGRTEEPIDPVRVLTNRSSGRMGVALAEEALERGARVTLVAGELSVPPPLGVEVVCASSAEDMRAAVAERFAVADALIMAAAVADFRPSRVEPTKIKRQGGPKSLSLEPTADIVREASLNRRPGQVVVGFALETEDGLARATRKLEEKGLDLVVLNNPTEPGSEFGGETNRVTIIGKDRTAQALPILSKREVARHILDRTARLLAAGREPS